jgi:hypothetical protein
MNTFAPKFTITHRMTAALIVFGLSPWAFKNNHLKMNVKMQVTKISGRR